MDPFSAIGLAGNIITFLDFGYKLLSKSKAIYKSTSGTTALNNKLASETQQLQGVTAGLQMPGLVGSLSDQEIALEQLAAECSIVSSDLTALINDLKTRNPNSMRESVRTAFRDWRKKDKKDELRLKLDRCRDQLNLQITTLMRAESLDRLNKLIVHGHASSNELRSLARNVESLQKGCNVSCLDTEALGQIRSLLGLTEEAVLKTRQARILDGLRFELMNERYGDIEDAHEKTFRWILDVEPEEDKEVEESNDTETKSTEESPDYDEVSDEEDYNDDDDDDDDDSFSQRRGNVDNSGSRNDKDSIHSGCDPIDDDNSSFERTAEPSSKAASEVESALSEDEISIGPSRIIRQPQPLRHSSEPLDEAMVESRNRFVTWLKHGDGIFHIIGKPGSGKSTLMKYICRQSITEKYLRLWAGDSELVTGKFFFWRPGSSLQKSLKGLVRGLLHCFLSKSPELIPLAFPEQWQASMYRETIHIENDECQKGFEALVSPSTTIKKHKFALFIDGLDEFEGDHAKLVRQLFSWVNNTQNIKICVSSREWTIFQEGFRDCPKLWLHDLTRLDIRRVIQDRFHEMDLPSLLDSTDESVFDSAKTLETEICIGSEGVFLWVVIVLRHIEDSLVNGGQMEDLIEVVRCFPTELEPLMYQLISSIPNANKKLAYATLLVVLHSRKYPKEYIKDQDFAMKIPVSTYSAENTIQRQERTRKRIYGVCKGFLELRPLLHSTRPIVVSITHLFGDTVRFTHRSIVEFLENRQFQEMARYELQDFEPFDAIIQTYLGLLRYLRLPRFYFAPKLASQTSKGLETLESLILSIRHTPTLICAPSPSFISDLTRKICLIYNGSISQRETERILRFLDDIGRTILDLGLNTAVLAIQEQYAGKIFRCPLGHIPFLVSVNLGLFEYVSLPCHNISSKLVVGCINTSLLNYVFPGVIGSPTTKELAHTRRFKVLEALLSQGTSVDYMRELEKLLIFESTFANWCIWGRRYLRQHLPHIALFLYHGIIPGVSLVLSKRVYETRFGLIHKAYFETEVRGEGDIVQTIRFNPLRWVTVSPSNWVILVHAGASGDRITAEYGFTLDFRALVSMLLPEHSNTLREVFDWNREVGISLDTDQRIKSLQSKFGRTLRPLFDQDHPDFVGWKPKPSIKEDDPILFIRKETLIYSENMHT
ncbi:uncharacterized protein F4807DRAFT_450400 [Annulohypoxylon truncatum]|uniref:uncharacterized protein n=1 Tax=Annulohypoxylon truncatum TaxID=327061 RepID=UPI002007D82F|nr:uncharacterized protein F4807DRAFT_450400 [Annulohypoxylon truncatum]KAI1212160.1 hypothetical protein F4807DRAFT_450400 [Annulohypoxylon truncatum]